MENQHIFLTGGYIFIHGWNFPLSFVGNCDASCTIGTNHWRFSILNPEDTSFLLQKCPNIHSTPPKFNMEPENKSLEKESPVGNHYFQVPC